MEVSSNFGTLDRNMTDFSGLVQKQHFGLSESVVSISFFVFPSVSLFLVSFFLFFFCQFLDFFSQFLGLFCQFLTFVCLSVCLSYGKANVE